MGAAQSSATLPEIPSLSDVDSADDIVNVGFQWNGYVNSHVYVTGSWDNWVTREMLTKTHAQIHTIVLSLPVGFHQYKFIVDGNWRHNPTLSSTADEHGNLNNVIDVKPRVSEYDVDPSAPKPPPSPPQTYDFSIMPAEDVRGEPPELPFSLAPVRSVDRAINFTRLDHLFVDNGEEDVRSEVRTMSVMERYHDKIIRTTHVYPRDPAPMTTPSPVLRHNAYNPLQAHVYQ